MKHHNRHRSLSPTPVFKEKELINPVSRLATVGYAMFGDTVTLFVRYNKRIWIPAGLVGSSSLHSLLGAV